MRKTLFGLAALAFVLPAVAAQSGVVCSPAHNGDLDRARAERSKGHFTAVLQIAQTVLKDEPQNLRAHYTIGLLKMDESASKTGAERARLRKEGYEQLTLAANGTDEVVRKKDAAAQACLKQQGVFSVMNTLAYYYSVENNLSLTERYLKKSLEYNERGLLNQDTARKTLGNIGSFYYRVGDFANAKTYLTRAVDAGNANPALKTQLRAIEVIK